MLFDGASLSISEKQKIGVIGRNGAGKSTLFKMILGEEDLDGGQILQMPGLRLGYIPQHDPFEQNETVIGFLERYTGKPEWECAKVASQFQLKDERLTGAVGDLSGGYQMRVKLAATLLFEPNLLLLDEPTNYLDLSTLVLLEKFLKTFKGGFLVITHDREFVKKTCEATLDVENGQLFLYPEPLEDYLEYKQEQKELAASVNKNIEAKQKQLQTFVDRFGAKASMAKSAQSKMKQIQRLDSKKIDIANPFGNVRMFIPKVQERAGWVLKCEDLSIGYPDKTVASSVSFELEKGRKVAILGDNGQGKSTLLKTWAGQIQSLAGDYKWYPNLKIAFYAQHVNLGLNPDWTVEQHLRSAADKSVKDHEVFQMMGNFLFANEDSKKQIKVLSGGEKARLCLAGMFLSKSDILLLDEPTNHLDFETVEAMGQALSEFNGTVVVVSHDRTFINLLANEIIEVKAGNVRKYGGTYEDYVWQLEQSSEEELGKQTIQNTYQKSQPETNLDPQPDYQNSNQPKELDKAARVELYNLRKELTKIERKIEKLKSQAMGGNLSWETQQILDEHETIWLEIQEKIENITL
ncbi:MAG: ABC-F family ATP-binding cassette domain-containing protein [Patescibacteria group bacterium]